MELSEDIIPVTYMGGTGGSFLCHFITNAKLNDKNLIVLSVNGNTHYAVNREIENPQQGVSKPDMDKINFIFEQDLDPTLTKPCYTNAHITDLKLITQYFKKSIRITYDLDDVNELCNVMFGKWYVDDVLGGKIAINQTYTKSTIKLGFLGWITKFNKQDIPNMLFISWKELFKGNIDELINKLSTFTDINTDNFSKESLIHWRNRTQQCIDKYSKF